MASLIRSYGIRNSDFSLVKLIELKEKWREKCRNKYEIVHFLVLYSYSVPDKFHLIRTSKDFHFILFRRQNFQIHYVRVSFYYTQWNLIPTSPKIWIWECWTQEVCWSVEKENVKKLIEFDRRKSWNLDATLVQLGR